jgi:integrase
MRKKKSLKRAASSHSLQDAIELFLAQYKKSSQGTYSYNLGNFSDFIGDNPLIEDITPTHILKYQQYVEGRNLADATRATCFKMLKVFFNWLVRMRLLDQSPARMLKTPHVSGAVEKEKAMTDEELRRLLEWAQWRPRDFALITFFADTGCRAGGAAGLRVQDIDFETMRALVTEKGDITWPVSFEAVCARALQAWLKKRPAGAGEYVFSMSAEPVQADSLSTAVRRACQKAGIRALGSHSIRHRKGHQMAYGLTPPSLAAQAMGHRVKTYLEFYSPTSWSEVDAVMRKFRILNIRTGRR